MEKENIEIKNKENEDTVKFEEVKVYQEVEPIKKIVSQKLQQGDYNHVNFNWCIRNFSVISCCIFTF